jgi:hypothetical protein
MVTPLKRDGRTRAGDLSWASMECTKATVVVEVLALPGYAADGVVGSVLHREHKSLTKAGGASARRQVKRAVVQAAPVRCPWRFTTQCQPCRWRAELVPTSRVMYA